VEPLAKDRSPARETEPVGPVSERRVEACLPHMPPPVAAMVRLQLLTGMRPGEACSMRRVDIDAGRKTWIYRPASHKAEHHGRSRVIPLGPQAQAVIRPFLPLDPLEPLFSPRAWMAESRPNATRVYADRYTKDTYGQAVDRACAKAFPHPKFGCSSRGLDAAQNRDLAAWQKKRRWSPNQLRHAYATRLRRLYGLEAAQVLLGHAKADTTEIYARRDLKTAVRIAAKVG
jgi:integrase